jgi:hypothetical protein
LELARPHQLRILIVGHEFFLPIAFVPQQPHLGLVQQLAVEVRACVKRKAEPIRGGWQHPRRIPVTERLVTAVTKIVLPVPLHTTPEGELCRMPPA